MGEVGKGGRGGGDVGSREYGASGRRRGGGASFKLRLPFWGSNSNTRGWVGVIGHACGVSTDRRRRNGVVIIIICSHSLAYLLELKAYWHLSQGYLCMVSAFLFDLQFQLAKST
jgi:hypothetical protein